MAAPPGPPSKHVANRLYPQQLQKAKGALLIAHCPPKIAPRYPTGAGFLPMLASFRARLPGVRPSTLVASVLFIAPFLRDIGAWSGFRKVRARPAVSGR